MINKSRMYRVFRVLFAALLFVLPGLSCRSPVGHGNSGVDCGFRFIVSGSIARGSGAERLLLPTATELEVKLQSADSSKAALVRTAPVSGTTVSVSFADLPVGSYTVTANAYKVPGTPLFTQIAVVDLGVSTGEVTLNLVPVDRPSVADPVSAHLDFPSLDPGTSATRLVPAGSGLFAGSSLLVSASAGSDLLFFVQSAVTGRLAARNSSGSVRGAPLDALPAGEDLYLTVYNQGGAAALPASWQARP